MDPYLKELADLASSRRYCKVIRERGCETHYGYVLAITNAFVTVEAFHDFYSKGVVLFRVDSVVRVEREERDEFFESVIEREGLRMRAQVPLHRTTDLRAALEWAMDESQLVALESESPIAEASEYWVGRPVMCDGSTVSLREVLPTGRWLPESTDVSLADVTQMEILSPYLHYFQKYAEKEVASTNSR